MMRRWLESLGVQGQSPCDVAGEMEWFGSFSKSQTVVPLWMTL